MAFSPLHASAQPHHDEIASDDEIATSYLWYDDLVDKELRVARTHRCCEMLKDRLTFLVWPVVEDLADEVRFGP